MPTEQGRGRLCPNSDIYAWAISIQALTGFTPTQPLEDLTQVKLSATRKSRLLWRGSTN